MDKINSQVKAVQNHLIKHGHITSMQAIEKFGATRLSSIIYILKKKGMNIKTNMVKGTNRYGNYTQYADYVLEDWGK